ncbi:MAG TPA: hypothetical protein VGC90_10295 [Candidatus Limnocylindrales bacterium]|jgi:hypothetical protein
MARDDSARSTANRELRNDSERLLKAVDELRALEREKRQQQISSQPFHDLAERVEAKAREVFRLAGEEVEDGRAAEQTGSSETIERAVADEVALPPDGGGPEPTA